MAIPAAKTTPDATSVPGKKTRDKSLLPAWIAISKVRIKASRDIPWRLITSCCS